MDLEQQIQMDPAPAVSLPTSFFPFTAVVGMALLVVLISEVSMWFLVYRKEDYQDTKRLVQQEQKKVEKVKAKANEKSQKRVQKGETRVNRINSELMRVKFKGFLLTAVLSIGAIKAMGSLFDNILVARLPFQPFNFLKAMTQSGLVNPGDRDCGYLFIYILSTMLFRSAIQYSLDLEGLALKKSK